MSVGGIHIRANLGLIIINVLIAVKNPCNERSLLAFSSKIRTVFQGLSKPILKNQKSIWESYLCDFCTKTGWIDVITVIWNNYFYFVANKDTHRYKDHFPDQ